MKKCFKCNIVKEFTEFYKNPRMADGRVNKCKECNKNDVKLNYITNKANPEYIEKERKRGREKFRRLFSLLIDCSLNARSVSSSTISSLSLFISTFLA